MGVRIFGHGRGVERKPKRAVCSCEPGGGRARGVARGAKEADVKAKIEKVAILNWFY